MYIKQRRYAEAETLALAAYDGYVRTFGAVNQDAQNVCRQLISIYTELGKPQELARWESVLDAASSNK